MKVTLLHHSQVLIELDHHILLFDCYQGGINVNQDKPLYIFASHSHGDHYSSSIFKIKHPDKHYILSSDIHRHGSEITSVKPHQRYTIDDLTVDTLFSTDMGVAFIVTVENKTIYFAGDLHDWYWIGEPDEDNDWQTATYLQEIKRINKPVDLACVVVDNRLEEMTFKGFDGFITHVKASHILPIHYFGDYSISQDLKKHLSSNPIDAQVLFVEHDNHTFNIN